MSPSMQPNAVDCCKCKGSFPRSLFSKSQAKKPCGTRQCRVCIEKAKVAFIAKGKEMGRVVEAPVEPRTQSHVQPLSSDEPAAVDAKSKPGSLRPRSQSHSSLSSTSSSSSTDERAIEAKPKTELSRRRSHSYSSAASSSSSSDERLVESETKITSPKPRTQSDTSASSSPSLAPNDRAKSKSASPAKPTVTKTTKLSQSSSESSTLENVRAEVVVEDTVNNKPVAQAVNLSCSSCNKTRDTKHFSNTQRRKKDGNERRCKSCVEASLHQGKQHTTLQSDNNHTSQSISTSSTAVDVPTRQQPKPNTLPRSIPVDTPVFGPALPPSMMAHIHEDEGEDDINNRTQTGTIDKKRSKLKVPKDDDSDVPKSHISPVSVLGLEDSLSHNASHSKACVTTAQETIYTSDSVEASSSADVHEGKTRQREVKDTKTSQKGALVVLLKVKRAVAKRLDKIHRLVETLCSRQPLPSAEQIKSQVHEDIGVMRKKLSSFADRMSDKYNNGEPPYGEAKALLETGLPATHKVVELTLGTLAKLKLKQAATLKTKKRRADDVVEEEEEEGLDKNKKNKKKKAKLDGKCDRCDGPHDAAVCPHYNKPRGSHQDARPGGVQGGLGASGGNMRLPHGREISMPGDGSCLFHSMAHGLRGQESLSASQLRRQLARWIGNNPNLKISGTPIKEWVRWDSGMNLRSYTGRMAQGGWGGGIEMAACSALFRCNVHVYEESRRRGGFKRISCFDYSKSARTVHVVYQGSCHYNALIPKGVLVQDPTEEQAQKKNKNRGVKRAFVMPRKDKGYGGKRHRADQMQQQQFGGSNKKGNVFNRGRRHLVKKNIKGRKRSFSR